MGVVADQWSYPAPWMAMILRNGDIKSPASDRELVPSLDGLGWRGAAMSRFDADGDLAGMRVSLSPSGRTMRGSQVGRVVLDPSGDGSSCDSASRSYGTSLNTL